MIVNLSTKAIGRKIFRVKIPGNASFSLQLFVLVHVHPVFSVLLTYSLKINSLLFDPPCAAGDTMRVGLLL